MIRKKVRHIYYMRYPKVFKDWFICSMELVAKVESSLQDFTRVVLSQERLGEEHRGPKFAKLGVSIIENIEGICAEVYFSDALITQCFDQQYRIS